MRLIGLPLTLLIILLQNIYAQNSDLLTKYSTGKYASVGGAGIGIVDDISAVDLNPAGLSQVKNLTFSFYQNLKYYSYYSFIINYGAGSITNEWNKLKYNLENILIAYPLNEGMTLSAGFIKKINPFIANVRRYITWSTMFSQETSGSIYAFALGSGFRISKNFSLGLTIYNYLGAINSKVVGDAHGRDSDKWASLKNDFSGFGFRFGGQARFGSFSTGIILELPTSLNVKTNKSISDDQAYQYLLPDWDETKFNLPLTLGIGFTYLFEPNTKASLDFETRLYKKSDIKINLYEYGGNPEWDNIYIIRCGMEFYPIKDLSLPLRLGYAYMPQLYFSNNSTAYGEVITSYENTSRIIRHNFTAGSSFRYSNFDFHFGIEYSILDWNRNLSSSVIVDENYTEKNITIFMQTILELN